MLSKVVHWDGTRWTRVTAPSPGGSNGITYLDGLGCASANSCWAFGHSGGLDRNNSVKPVALRWDGIAWKVASASVLSTRRAGNLVNDLSCPSAELCFGAGAHERVVHVNKGLSGINFTNAVLQWNGKSWTALAVPSPTRGGSSLAAITCPSALNCWAVGGHTKGGVFLTQALHWDGQHWSLVRTPNPGGTQPGRESGLSGIACLSDNDCLAVGSYEKGWRRPQNNLALRWGGTSWSATPTPNPAQKTLGGIQELYGIACPTSSECWAVGDYFRKNGALLNEVLHWNGESWEQATVPNPSGTRNPDSWQSLGSVACSSATDCWAVGAYFPNPNGTLQISEVLHWDGTHWAFVPVP